MEAFIPAIFIGLIVWFILSKKHKKENKKIFDIYNRLSDECRALREERDKLQPYQAVLDAEKEAARIKSEIERSTQESLRKAQEILDDAEKKAVEIAGEALEAKRNADHYERTVEAMKNIINGYGNEYIIPSRSLLDDLADTYGYTQAGEDLKQARSNSKKMIKDNAAARCEYVEALRARTAVNFVTDAFNGKVDSILSRAKIDNFGKLKQEMIDAFNLVNNNGKAFRDARITEEYFNARLNELKLACTLHEIRQRDIEEQRWIKEQMREEEKVRREIEKALREAAKEEELLQKALEKARAQLAEASEEQRAILEAQIDEWKQKCKEAEERKQRAMSRAQQTKKGKVYIISNVGSFGENVYKIGMTRREKPDDRVRELGDASVPFPFDVHAMIDSDDAPALETQLHKTFAAEQMNKVNYHKEFFRVPLQRICEVVDGAGINVQWTMIAEATQYYETLAIEKEIATNPIAREAWLNRQYSLEQKTALQLVRGDSEEDDFEEEESA